MGRVRAMHDHMGRLVEAATPATPVEIIGLSGVPDAGDRVDVVEDERTAREASEWRMESDLRRAGVKSSAASLSDLLGKIQTEDQVELALIIKADTQGSIEAVCEVVQKLNTPRVSNKIIHRGVGGVTESDITLAAASKAVVIGFNVRAARGLDEHAENLGVPVKYFSIIYELSDAVKALMAGKLPPVVKEVVLGHAEVRQAISVPRIGTVAGSSVLDGKITRGAMVRLLRDNIVIYTGKLGSLRRFKDDVKEVQSGYECGIAIEGYNDVKVGDTIEAFLLEESAATL
jgi:translation initiation factor IF-2